MTEQNDKTLCKRCQHNDACKPHTCPYLVDIYNDCETLCNCCEECMHECSMDV